MQGGQGSGARVPHVGHRHGVVPSISLTLTRFELMLWPAHQGRHTRYCQRPRRRFPSRRLVSDHLAATAVEPIERLVNEALSPEMLHVRDLDRDPRVRVAVVPPTTDRTPPSIIHSPVRAHMSATACRSTSWDASRPHVAFNSRHALPCRSPCTKPLLHGCCTQTRHMAGSRRSTGPSVLLAMIGKR